MLKIVNASEVRELLPMNECLDVMARAMQAASGGEVHVPPRTFMSLYDDSAILGLMPGSVRDPKIYGAKVVSLHYENPKAGLPAIQGFVALFDHDRGTPLAVIEGAEITAIRTAAASGMATRCLARGDACTHGIFGTGVQAVSHIEAIAAARPISETVIWGRDFAKAKALARDQSEKYDFHIRATDDAAEAGACDVISTVTASSQPVLEGQSVRDGAHVNLVGSHTPTAREADSDLVARGSVYADLLESLMNEAGDILIPLNEGRITKDNIRGEIGQVLNGDISGRSSNDEITIYKSCGNTAQDLFAAQAIYAKAVSENKGIDVDLQN